MFRTLRRLAALLLLAVPATALAQNPYLSQYLAEAKAALKAKKLDRAQELALAALERDSGHTEALALLAEIALARNDKDLAIYTLHTINELGQRGDKVEQQRAARARKQLEDLDSDADSYRKLRQNYLEELLALAAAYEKRERDHSALLLYAHAREVDPFAREPADGIKRIRRTGKSDVAVADVYAGGDPSFGKSEEWIRTEDEKHSEWPEAWTHETTNYRYRTNAGYRVLMTSAIAMENVNLFYRKFFHYKEDGGKIPKIEIRIFKNRDEYLTLGKNPVPWSGGHFIGNAVETYVGGVTGNESIRRMYGTLFHEAAHHFVSLTCPGCPGWLNEAYASFFEGTEILSNGSVRWNRVPNHRLFPLAKRMEHGWMRSPTAGIKADGTGSPENAPTFRMVVENNYRWGPPWYAPTWGVVYFLFNYRDADGRLVYRDALNEYYYSFKGRRPRDPIAHFEETVLASKRSPVKTIDALNDVWKRWILELRDQEVGKIAKGTKLLDFAERALERKDTKTARELLEEAWLADPNNPEILFRLAGLLERQHESDRAAGLYRDFQHALELARKTDDPRYATAGKKIESLDPLVRRYRRLQAKTAADGLALARSYQKRKLPLMALSIAKKMSAQFSLPEALDLYREIALATGKSLARWKLAYNEMDLRGWSDDGNSSYVAYGKRIRAHVADDPSVEKHDGGFVTRALTCDVAFESDVSLETEILIDPARVDDPAKVVGLCFGRKDSQNFHAVLLHPKGFLDLAANHGGVWQALDHRQVQLAHGWNKLRIDVAGRHCDYYLNGLFLRSYEFPGPEVLRGGFGLITGVGTTYYRHVRLLARPENDPAAQIERELAMKRIAEDPRLRASHSYAGFRPPELEGGEWVRGPAFDPGDPGWPTILFFWTQNQERYIPTLAYMKSIVDQWCSKGFRLLLVAGDRVSPTSLGITIEKHFGEHPPDGLFAITDHDDRVFAAFGIVPGGYGLPRAVVVDIDGRVTFEGDPGLRKGEAWTPDQKTYLDDALAKLAQSRHLVQLVALVPALSRAPELLRAGKLSEAVQKLRPLAELPVESAIWVREARALLDGMEQSQVAVVEGARALADSGWPLKAVAEVEAVAAAFPDRPLAKQAARVLGKIRNTSAWRKATGAAKLLDKAEDWVRRGRSKDDVQVLLKRARNASPTREIAARADAILASLK